MDIYMIQHDYRSNYLVMLNENTHVSVYKNEKNKFDQPFVSFQAKNIFVGKSKIRAMTEFSGVLDDPNFDGSTILLECEDSKYVYISGVEVFEFRINDKIIGYISIMGNIMIPYTFAVGEKYTYFISTQYKFIGNDKIEESKLLNSSDDSLDPYDYHLSKYGVDSFKKLIECNRIHSFWLSIGSEKEEID